jgi:hypothetical protein
VKQADAAESKQKKNHESSAPQSSPKEAVRATGDRIKWRKQQQAEPAQKPTDRSADAIGFKNTSGENSTTTPNKCYSVVVINPAKQQLTSGLRPTEAQLSAPGPAAPSSAFPPVFSRPPPQIKSTEETRERGREARFIRAELTRRSRERIFFLFLSGFCELQFPPSCGVYICIRAAELAGPTDKAGAVATLTSCAVTDRWVRTCRSHTSVGGVITRYATPRDTLRMFGRRRRIGFLEVVFAARTP